jgi:hypothetical protein
MMIQRCKRAVIVSAFALVGCGATEDSPNGTIGNSRIHYIDPASQSLDPRGSSLPTDAFDIVPTNEEDGLADPSRTPTYPEVAPLAVIPVATEPYDPATTPPVAPAGADGIIPLTWAPLSAWKYVPERTPLPKPLEEALDGKRVRIVGHLFPILDSAKPKEIVIMRQGWQCCLIGRPPELNEVIRIEVPDERRQTIPGLLLEVEGEDFQVEEVIDDGFVVEIYTMKLVALRAVPEGTSTER